MLNAKQRRFVDEYLVDLNATQAAIRAGYSARSAHNQGCRMMTNGEVVAAIAERQKARVARTGVTAERVLQALEEIAFADPRELVQMVVRPCHACWQETETPERRDGPDCSVQPDCPECRGDGHQHVVFKDCRMLSPAAARLYAGAKIEKGSIQVLMKNQQDALMALAKHLRLLTDRVEISGDEKLADQLAKAIQRTREVNDADHG